MLLNGVWLVSGTLMAEKEYEFVRKVYVETSKEAETMAENYFTDKGIQTIHMYSTKLSVGEWKAMGNIRILKYEK